MSGEDGINLLLKVESPLTCDSTLITCDSTLFTCDEGAGLFLTLKGQMDTTFSPTTQIADTTSKDAVGWAANISTTRSSDISVSGIFDATDTAFLKLQNTWLSNKNVSCELVVNAALKKWTGKFRLENMPVAGTVGDATKYDITLKSDGVLLYT